MLSGRSFFFWPHRAWCWRRWRTMWGPGCNPAWHHWRWGSCLTETYCTSPSPSQMTDEPVNLLNVLKPQVMCVVGHSALPLTRKSVLFHQFYHCLGTAMFTHAHGKQSWKWVATLLVKPEHSEKDFAALEREESQKTPMAYQTKFDSSCT